MRAHAAEEADIFKRVGVCVCVRPPPTSGLCFVMCVCVSIYFCGPALSVNHLIKSRQAWALPVHGYRLSSSPHFIIPPCHFGGSFKFAIYCLRLFLPPPSPDSAECTCSVSSCLSSATLLLMSADTCVEKCPNWTFNLVPLGSQPRPIEGRTCGAACLVRAFHSWLHAVFRFSIFFKGPTLWQIAFASLFVQQVYQETPEMCVCVCALNREF